MLNQKIEKGFNMFSLKDVIGYLKVFAEVLIGNIDEKKRLPSLTILIRYISYFVLIASITTNYLLLRRFISISNTYYHYAQDSKDLIEAKKTIKTNNERIAYLEKYFTICVSNSTVAKKPQK